MRIDKRHTLRDVVGEKMLLIQGRTDAEKTKVIAFNESSAMLWEAFLDKDFTVEEVKQKLLDTYEVDEATASNDAAQWVKTLQEHKIIL